MEEIKKITEDVIASLQHSNDSFKRELSSSYQLIDTLYKDIAQYKFDNNKLKEDIETIQKELEMYKKMNNLVNKDNQNSVNQDGGIYSYITSFFTK